MLPMSTNQRTSYTAPPLEHLGDDGSGPPLTPDQITTVIYVLAALSFWYGLLLFLEGMS